MGVRSSIVEFFNNATLSFVQAIELPQGTAQLNARPFCPEVRRHCIWQLAYLWIHLRKCFKVVDCNDNFQLNCRKQPKSLSGELELRPRLEFCPPSHLDGISCSHQMLIYSTLCTEKAPVGPRPSRYPCLLVGHHFSSTLISWQGLSWRCVSKVQIRSWCFLSRVFNTTHVSIISLDFKYPHGPWTIGLRNDVGVFPS